MIDRKDKLPVTRQCSLLDLSRSGIYYQPVPLSAKDLALMRQIEEIHLVYPFYGSRKIRNELWSRGYDIGRDRVRRLMRRMGIEALYIKPRLSLAHSEHKARSCDYQSQPGMDGRYNVHSHGERLLLSGGNYGLGFPDGSGLAVVQHPGQFVLRGRAGKSHDQIWLPRDFQYRSRQPVYR